MVAEKADLGFQPKELRALTQSVSVDFFNHYAFAELAAPIHSTDKTMKALAEIPSTNPLGELTESIQRTNKAMEALAAIPLTNPLLSLAETLDSINRATKLIEERTSAKAISRLVENIRSTNKTMEALATIPFTDAFSSLTEAVESINGAKKFLDERLSATSFTVVAENAFVFERMKEPLFINHPFLDQSPKLNQTLSQIHSDCEAVAERGKLETEEAESLLNKLLDYFLISIKEVKENSSPRLYLICIWHTFLYLLPIILSIQSTISTNSALEEIQIRSETNTEYNRTIESKLNDLRQQFDSIAEEIDKGTYYIAKRHVPLNITTKLKSNFVAIIYPGQTVELIDRIGKWIKVRAIDMDGSEKTGWVLKKYLKLQR